MKFKRTYFAVLFCFASVALADATPAGFDESVDFTPSFQIYQSDPRLSDLFNSAGRSPLCFPTSIAHRMLTYKFHRDPALTQLEDAGDRDGDGKVTDFDYVRLFAKECKTLPFDGTSLANGLACMRDYLRRSGYADWVYAIGSNVEEAPPGAQLSEFQRTARISDLRRIVAQDQGVIVHVGWYTQRGRRWIRTGGHYFNVYGFDYNQAWKEDRLILRVANPWVDYANRPASEMHDRVVMRRLEKPAGWSYPWLVDYTLEGTGFDYDYKRGFVEDLIFLQPRATPSAR